MPDPVDPPRPSLRSGVRNFLAACAWSQTNQRVEDGSGKQVYAWLNQTGTPGITVTVQWDAGIAQEAGSLVMVTITNESFTIIKNGTYNGQTGLVSYNNKNYRFSMEISGAAVEMKAWAV